MTAMHDSTQPTTAHLADGAAACCQVQHQQAALLPLPQQVAQLGKAIHLQARD